MAILRTYGTFPIKEGDHYFREDRSNPTILLSQPQELICFKVFKGSAIFTTTDYEQGYDKGGDYINGEMFRFGAKYIANHLHSTKSSAIHATIMTLDSEVIELKRITRELEDLLR